MSFSGLERNLFGVRKFWPVVAWKHVGDFSPLYFHYKWAVITRHRRSSLQENLSWTVNNQGTGRSCGCARGHKQDCSNSICSPRCSGLFCWSVSICSKLATTYWISCFCMWLSDPVKANLYILEFQYKMTTVWFKCWPFESVSGQAWTETSVPARCCSFNWIPSRWFSLGPQKNNSSGHKSCP